MSAYRGFIAGLKTVGAMTPIGSGIVTMIDEFVPSAHDKANAEATKIVAERLDELGERFDETYLKTNEFADLFKNCYAAIQRTQHKEKQLAAANTICSMLLRDAEDGKLPYEELDHFARCIENLSIGAFELLRKAIERAELGMGNGRHKLAVEREPVTMTFGTLRSLFPNTVDHDLLMGLVQELNSYHLLHFRGASSVRLEQYSNFPIDATPLGYRFVKHILKPGEQPTCDEKE